MPTDGVAIYLGDNVWTFGTNFLVYLIIATIVGFVAESLVSRRLPYFTSVSAGALLSLPVWLQSECGRVDILNVRNRFCYNHHIMGLYNAPNLLICRT